MVRFKVTQEEAMRLRDYLKYVEITPETLLNEILALCISRSQIGISSKIEKHTIKFLKFKEDIDLLEVIEFIESIDVRDIVFNFRIKDTK